MSTMMHSTGVLIALMIFLILVMGGVLVAVHRVGGRQFDKDHPR